jgi:hypothetical protein
VSIKSFPDYKYLLQENYSGIQIYIYFLQLLQIVSKIFQQDGAPPHWGTHVRRFFWMQHFQAFATITEDVLENTLREIEYRLDILRATKAAQVEVY